MEYELNPEDCFTTGTGSRSCGLGDVRQKSASPFRAQLIQLAEEHERLYDSHQLSIRENARLRSILNQRGYYGPEDSQDSGLLMLRPRRPSVASAEEIIKPSSMFSVNKTGFMRSKGMVQRSSKRLSCRSTEAHRGSIDDAWQNMQNMSAIDEGASTSRVPDKASEITTAREPPSPRRQASPLYDPLAAAEVLSERTPFAANSDLERFQSLKPQEHRHTEKPHVEIIDTAPIVLDLSDADLRSEKRCASDVDSLDTFESMQPGEVGAFDDEDEIFNGLGRLDSAAAGIFPRWFDPGDIEEQAFFNGENSMSLITPLGDAELENNADRYTLLPFGCNRLTWDFCAFLCILCELWMTPFQLIYCDSMAPLKSLDYLSYTINAFFGIDIILNFNTGYIDGDLTIMQRRKICVNYIKFWFWIDMLATVPWDLVLQSFGGVMTFSKMGKASKTLKAVRYLKMLRLIKLLRTMQQANSWFRHSQILGSLAERFKAPCQLAIFLVLFAHIHGLIYAALQPADWLSVDTVPEALRRYGESCWWVLTAVSSGVPPGAQFKGSVSIPGVWLLDMIVIFERFLTIFAVSNKIILASLCFIDEARTKHARQEIMKHLRQNKVSIQTQIQVLFSMTETGKVKNWRKFFPELMSSDLPRVLQRTICAELWSSKLESMGLIRKVAEWHSGFVKELAQLAREEVFPSRSIVFKLGEASHVAYYIVTGVLMIRETLDRIEVPDFTKGMWVGETALVSTILRRSATCVSKSITSCMAVYGDQFQQLLSSLGLTQEFQTFCAEHLWQGICGRCGILGDHFSDTCHDNGRGFAENVTQSIRASIRGSKSGNKKQVTVLEKMQSKGLRPSKNARISTNSRESFTHTASISSQAGRLNSRDLYTFLKEADVPWLLQALQDIDICTLSALEEADTDLIRDMITEVAPESDIDALMKIMSPSTVRNFRERNSRKAHRALFHDVSRLHHLIFLSHYKVEAGTEAALMRNELEMAMKQDAGHIGNGFDEPVFLDSDNLVDLGDLQQRVRNTHNVVLLLTKGVLARPWVLVEIMTARHEGVRIILVNVSKPGQTFLFPEDSFYNELRTGKYLEEEAVEVIRRCGFTLDDVEESLKAVFHQIAVPYSPHKSSSIRRAEISGVLKQCRLKTDGGRLTADSGHSQILTNTFSRTYSGRFGNSERSQVTGSDSAL